LSPWYPRTIFRACLTTSPSSKLGPATGSGYLVIIVDMFLILSLKRAIVSRIIALAHPYDRGNADTWLRAKEVQKYESVLLTLHDAQAAAVAMIEACVNRGWLILQAAIMANHVHVVVADCPDDGPAVRRVLKGTRQAAMSRQFGRPRKWWTEGGSDRYKHDDAAITAAVNYVANQSHPLVFIVKNELVLPSTSTGTSPVAR
jgi:REP element-mobilizing transposase RayT